MRDRLSPRNRFGLHLAVGILVLFVAAWLFGAIAEDVVTNDALTLADQTVLEWLHARATPPFTKAMLLVSYLGAPAVVILIAFATALYLWWFRRFYRLLALVLAVPGGMLLNVLIKYTVHRHRPAFSDPLLIINSYSFPSGHALGSTVLYGVLAAFAVWTANPWPPRVLAVLVAGVLIGIVYFSRVYLGVHYLTDVLGGITEGVAWLALCLTAVETLRRGRLERKRVR